MSLGEFFVGSVLLGATLGCVVAAASTLAGGGARSADRLARGVAVGLIATTLLIAAHVIPLALGLLTRVSAVLTAAGMFVCVRVVGRGLHDRGRWASAPSSPPSGSLAAALALGAGLVAAVAGIVVAIRDAPIALDHVDMVSFHLPVVADWVQSGSAWQITQHIPQQAQGAYPHNGDVLLLALVLPWHSDFLVRLAEYPFLVFSMAAMVGVARELRCSTATGTLVALTLISMPAVLQSAVKQAMPDTVLVAGFAAALLFLLRHRRTGSSTDLVLAGLGLGLGFGTKWYGVSSAVVAIALWTSFSAYSARRARASLRPTFEGTAILTAGTVAVGGFWLLRNAVETGNPVFPVELAVLGVTLFDAPPDFIRDRVGFSIADYVGEPWVWRDHLLPAFRAAFGPGGGLLAVLAVTGLAVGLSRRIALVTGLALAGAVLAATYAVTPYTALGFEGAPVAAEVNARYGVPALIAAAAVAAWALSRAGPSIRRVGQVALTVAICAGVRDALAFGWGEMLAIALAVCLLVALVQMLLGVRPPRPRLVVAGAGALLVVGGLGSGFALARDFEEHRYRGADPVIDFVLERLSVDGSVGLTGIWDTRGVSPILAGYGDGLQRQVRYLGRLDDGMLWRHPTESSFLADLRRRPVDAIVVGLAKDIYTGVGPRELTWLRRAGYHQVLASPRLTLFLAPGKRGRPDTAP